MKLSIVIPALNEEDSIEAIIERSIGAIKYISDHSPITGVEITVVSDGSTDRTVELASRYRDDIHLIVFERNRGYGAAIQAAWDDSNADLLGFLDADGTCEPNFFANLCNAVVTEKADLVLGCRLNKHTKMPVLRQIGNHFFAFLLSLLSNCQVRDAASGMRVIKRETYQRLLPLPNGLHFTPAMSARALLGAAGTIKVLEIDMPYRERQGISKLNVTKDGFRFLKTIVGTAFLYKPRRVLSPLAGIFLIIGIFLILMFGSNLSRLQTAWPVSPLILGCTALLSGVLLLSTASTMQRIADLAVRSTTNSIRLNYGLKKLYTHPSLWAVLLSMTINILLASHFTIGDPAHLEPHLFRSLSIIFSVLSTNILLLEISYTYLLNAIKGSTKHKHSTTKAQNNLHLV